MKKIYSIFLLLVSLLFIWGCEKEIPFEESVSNPKLVINSLFTSDSVWTVHISRSLSVLDPGDLVSVFNADVRIFDESGNEVAKLTHDTDGYYKSDSVFPLPSTKYRIEVSAEGYETVWAEDAIPGAIEIISLDTLTTRQDNGQTTLEISLSFKDPAGVANYYMIEMLSFATWKDYYGDEETFSFPNRIHCDDPNVETDNSFNFLGDNNAYDYILLKDAAFDGENYTIDFYVRNWTFEKEVEISAIMSLVASSETFFNYRRSYGAYQKTQNNPFSQPVQVYSNVQNGIGIFGGGTRTVWEVDF